MPKLKPIISAILKWPRGLDYPPVVYPSGGSENIDKKIIALLEKHLGERDE